MVVALGVFAWQQGGDGSDGPLNAIAAAAERTRVESSGRATIHSVVTSPVPSESITVSGRMVFDGETGRSRAVMLVPQPGTDGPAEMHVVGDGLVMYMRSDLFGSLPDGREWMALDLSLGDDLEIPVPANGDAMGELELLEAVSGDVRKLGREDVRGVPATRYRATVGVSEQAEQLRKQGGEKLATLVEEEGTPLRLEVWIDDEGLVRRVGIVKSQPRENGEGSMTIEMRMNFFDFGLAPEIDLPESSEVFDATALVEDELGRSDDG